MTKSDGNGFSTKDWFFLGMFAGVVYSAWKNPGSCACALGCLAILALLLLVGVAVFLWQNLWLVGIIVLGWTAVLWYRQPGSKEQFGMWMRRRRDEAASLWRRR